MPDQTARPGSEDSAEASLSVWTRSQDLRETAARPPHGGFTPGTMLAGRFRIVAPLGRGGMGEVYRADDTRLGQVVALKFVRGAPSPELLNRHYAEARTGREISHPNVCRLYDVVEVEGQTFLAMEYVDGEDLASLLARIGRLPPDKALEIAHDLAAGLAAVHERGVVHRDLKPANVMIDGRGRARLTDFGLAFTLKAPGSDTTAGTPAYMAPEQLSGSEVTLRSDLYSLGLILFEMFTGQRFFDARTVDELLTQHREAKTGRLSSVSRLLEPNVERLIRQCLDEDPAARPASARALIGALPGLDPLEAAIAAGETPSPEMVAAASKVGDLTPARAWSALITVLAGMVAVAYLSEQITLVNRALLPKPPDVLAERARQVLTRLGHPPGADSAWSFEWDGAFLDYIRAHDPSAHRWEKSAHAAGTPLYFFYRQSPQRLVATNRDAAVRQDDPPADVSGMADVVLDPGGRLYSYLAVPPQVEAGGPWPEPDWSALFQEAGLDPAAFQPAEPNWAAPVDSDRKAAWHGAFPGHPEVPLRIEAAAYHGRPVWFTLLAPWTKAARMVDARSRSSPTPFGETGVTILALVMPLGGVLLARHNLRLGRGDRKGAFRVALFVFATYSLARLLRADHVSATGDELWILIKVFAYPSLWALQVWLLYIALEPYARRRWPEILISWKRLLAGNLRDPLVGRDLLLGSAAGAMMTVAHLLTSLLPLWFDRPPLTLAPFVNGATLTALRHVGFRLFVNQFSAVLFAMVFLFLLVLLRVVVRRTWLAVVLWCVLAALPAAAETPAFEWLSGATRALIVIVVLTRGGLLQLTVALLFMFSIGEVPVTLDVSAWFAAHSFPVVLVLSGLALYGFHTSLAGKPMFGALDD